MSEFARVLKGQVRQAHHKLGAACQAGDEELADREASRLAELLELAGRHGVDTTHWLDPAVRSFLDDRDS